MMRRCQFFFNVFGLELPEYLSCSQFIDSNNPEICVGQRQMRDAYNRALKPGKTFLRNFSVHIHIIVWPVIHTELIFFARIGFYYFHLDFYWKIKEYKFSLGET